MDIDNVFLSGKREAASAEIVLQSTVRPRRHKPLLDPPGDSTDYCLGLSSASDEDTDQKDEEVVSAKGTYSSQNIHSRHKQPIVSDSH